MKRGEERRTHRQLLTTDGGGRGGPQLAPWSFEREMGTGWRGDATDCLGVEGECLCERKGMRVAYFEHLGWTDRNWH